MRARLGIDERELQDRRAVFELGDDDLSRLAALRPLAERHVRAIVHEFYAFLGEHPGTQRFLVDEALVRRLERTQSEYFLRLFEGRCDLAYVEDRLRVGEAHERIGLAPKWYIAAYRKYLQMLAERVLADVPDEAERAKAMQGAIKLIAFDVSLAIDTYIEAGLVTLGRHQRALRELSTPVIRVYDGLLLLPLVGAVDSLRAQQVTEMVLARVVEEQARAIIIDIAGVPVVDTKVAAHLLQTADAVRLLGAETIVTGIGADVASTIVRLGVDVGGIHTSATLARGIELGLRLLGKRVAEHGPGGTYDTSG